MPDLTLGGYSFPTADFEDGKYLDFMSIEGSQYPRHLGIFVAWKIEASSAKEALWAGLVATSASSVTVGSGSKVFAVGTGKGFVAGAFVSVIRDADPTTFMTGQVASYSGGDLTVTVGATGYAGAGTFSDWTVSVSGQRGPQGPEGEGLSAGDAWGYILSMY